jgi:predicted RecA/RadA family phage recombinase
MALARTFRCINEDYAKRVDVVNNSVNAFSEGDGFYISAGTITALADANTVGIYGVWCEDVAAGATGAAWVEGIFSVAVAGALDFAINEPVYMASVSTVDKGANPDKSVGNCVGAEPAASAARVIIYLTSQINTVTTHA